MEITKCKNTVKTLLNAHQHQQETTVPHSFVPNNILFIKTYNN